MVQTAMHFDTLRFAKKLINAGFTPRQAEAQAEVFADVIDENLATKKDTTELNTKISILDKDLRLAIKQSELNLTIRVGTMLAASISIMVVLIPIIMKLLHL